MTTEIRIPLENGTELPFSRLTPVTIEGEPIGYGGSCIAYRAYRFEGNIKRYCIVKECYPKKLASANMLERKGKNLKSKKESVTEFKTQKNLFKQGYTKGIIYEEADRQHSLHSDWDKCNNTIYIVSELQEGDSLDKNYQTLKNPHQIYEVIESLCGALKVLHGGDKEVGMPPSLHLDIKPANVFLFNETEGSRRVALFDFDTVTPIDEAQSGSTRYSYSPGWAAWEQVKGQYEELGPWTDLYAVGLLLFWLLMQELPTKEDIRSILAGTFDLRRCSHFYSHLGEYDEAEYQALLQILSASLEAPPQFRRKAMDEFHDALIRFGGYSLTNPTIVHEVKREGVQTRKTIQYEADDIRKELQQYGESTLNAAEDTRQTVEKLSEDISITGQQVTGSLQEVADNSAKIGKFFDVIKYPVLTLMLAFFVFGLVSYLRHETNVGRNVQLLETELLFEWNQNDTTRASLSANLSKSSSTRAGTEYEFGDWLTVHSIFQNARHETVAVNSGKVVFTQKEAIIEPAPVFSAVSSDEGAFYHLYAVNNGWGSASKITLEFSGFRTSYAGNDEAEYPFADLVLLEEDFTEEGQFDLEGGEILKLVKLSLNIEALDQVRAEQTDENAYMTLYCDQTLRSADSRIDETRSVLIGYNSSTDTYFFDMGGRGGGGMPYVSSLVPIKVNSEQMEYEFDITALISDYIELKTVVVPDRSCVLTFKMIYDIRDNSFETEEFSTSVYVPIYSIDDVSYFLKQGITHCEYGSSAQVLEDIGYDNYAAAAKYMEQQS